VLVEAKDAGKARGWSRLGRLCRLGVGGLREPDEMGIGPIYLRLPKLLSARHETPRLAIVGAQRAFASQCLYSP